MQVDGGSKFRGEFGVKGVRVAVEGSEVSWSGGKVQSRLRDACYSSYEGVWTVESVGFTEKGYMNHDTTKGAIQCLEPPP